MFIVLLLKYVKQAYDNLKISILLNLQLNEFMETNNSPT